jgi:hypothetical protein
VAFFKISRISSVAVFIIDAIFSGMFIDRAYPSIRAT